MRRLILVLAMVASGCTTSKQADALLAKKYVGANTDTFFARFGPPQSNFKLNNGDTVFTWAERARYWSSSGTASTTIVGNSAYSSFSAPEKHLQQCQLKLVAGPSGAIKEISVLADSLGVWQMSRCNEYFSSRT